MTTFDRRQSEQLRDRGKAIAEANNWSDLELARWIAVRIARQGDGTCDANRVNMALKNLYGIDTLGNSAGALFKGKGWKFAGRWTKSTKVSSHARYVRVWRLEK